MESHKGFFISFPYIKSHACFVSRRSLKSSKAWERFDRSSGGFVWLFEKLGGTQTLKQMIAKKPCVFHMCFKMK